MGLPSCWRRSWSRKSTERCGRLLLYMWFDRHGSWFLIDWTSWQATYPFRVSHSFCVCRKQICIVKANFPRECCTWFPFLAHALDLFGCCFFTCTGKPLCGRQLDCGKSKSRSLLTGRATRRTIGKPNALFRFRFFFISFFLLFFLFVSADFFFPAFVGSVQR